MRLIHGASPLLTVALLLGTAGQAGADPAPAPDGLGALIAAVADKMGLAVDAGGKAK